MSERPADRHIDLTETPPEGIVVPFRGRDVIRDYDTDGDGVPDAIVMGRDRHDQDHDTDGLEVTVAPAKSATVVRSSAELLPIVPAWARTRAGFTAHTRWWLGLQWYRARFYAVRGLLALPRVVGRIPLGALRVTGVTLRWVFDTRAVPLEADLATAGRAETKAFLAVREDRSARIKARLIVLALGAILAAGVTVWLEMAGTSVQRWAALALVLVVLARVGSIGRPSLVGPVMIASGRHREMTDVIVLRALRAAGLGGSAAKLNKGGDVVEESTVPTLAAPIVRAENGSGYVVVVDLPYGKTVADAAAARDKLASGLDVDEPQVLVEAVRGSTRRVCLYVADEDPFTLPPRRSPMARLPKVSVWDAHPLGTEPRGREVRPSLIFNSYLIGAIPRSGKTFAARALVAPAILDPHCDVTVLDLKGGKDWTAVEPLAVRFLSGDDTEDLAYAVAVLGELKREAQERFKAFRSQSTEDNPEGKLTPELARAGMRPHLIVIDEVQNLLRASEKAIRDEALALLIWLAKTGPAAGFVLVLATQRPAADVIPADLRDNTSVRLALRTKTWQSSDAILGAGTNALGFGTARFMEEHHGASIIGGVSNGRGGDLSVMRTDLLTIADFDAVCRAGRQRRADAGTLRGQAVGEDDDVVVTVTVLEDVLAVWPGDDAKCQAQTLVERLAELRPNRHHALDSTRLTQALKEHGVAPVQVFRGGSNRNGYRLADLRKAAAKAIEPRSESD